LQDAFREFKFEVKKSFSEKEIKEMEKYMSKTGDIVSLSDYHVKSEYATTSEYKQKSDYDVNLVMLEEILKMEELPWTSGLRTLTPASLLST